MQTIKDSRLSLVTSLLEGCINPICAKCILERIFFRDVVAGRKNRPRLGSWFLHAVPSLEDVNLNDSWDETAETLEENEAITDDVTVVSDAEESLVNAFETSSRSRSRRPNAWIQAVERR